MKNLYSTREVAEELGLTVGGLNKNFRDGCPDKSIRLSGIKIFDNDAILAIEEWRSGMPARRREAGRSNLAKARRELVWRRRVVKGYEKTMVNRPYTTEEVCEELGITDGVIRHWFRSGCPRPKERRGSALVWYAVDIAEVEKWRDARTPRYRLKGR